MINNRYISYKIHSNDSCPNNEDSSDLIGVNPIKSYEIKIAKIPILKHRKVKNNYNINEKLKLNKKEKSILAKLQKLRKKSLSSIRERKKKINIVYFNNIEKQNDFSKLENNINNDFNRNERNLFKKLNCCKSLILGKYPTLHGLLLPIQHDFVIDNHYLLKRKLDIYKRKKKEIIDETEEKNKKEEKSDKIIKKEIKKIKKNKKIIIKDEIKKEIEKEEQNGKNDVFKDKIKIFMKINKNKDKDERTITSSDKITRINEYNNKIKKMNLIRIRKRIKEKEEEINKEKSFDNKINELIDYNITNKNRKNKLDKIGFKSKSISNIFDIKKIENIKPKYLKPIKNEINLIIKNEKNDNIKTEINDKKEIIKTEINDKKEKIKENNEKKEEIKENNEKKEDNIQPKESKNYNIENWNRAVSHRVYKEKVKYKSNYLLKEELLERLIKTRKEYLEKEKKQSQQNINEHYYLIFPGNASYLIKNCMKHRYNWKEAFSDVTSFYNFKWTALSTSLDYTSLGVFPNSKQLVNHFEYHYTISNKANMFFNLMEYCEKNKISVFKYVPFTIVYKIKDRSKYSDDIKEIKRKKNLENLKIFIENTDKYIKSYDELGKYFENNDNNNIKKELETEIDENLFVVENIEENNTPFYSNIFKNFNKYKKEEKNEKTDKDKNDKKGGIIKIGMNTMIEIPISHFSYRNIWMIKAINLNRGKCIKVANNFTEIEKIIDKFRQGVNFNFTEEEIINEDEKENEEKKDDEENTYYCDNIIIQKYIENPLLYKGRKFDMRIWVLLTHQMKVYIFKEGHLKTCSIKYDINSRDSFSHITNYSFQKHNNNFEKYEKGNEVPFYEFQNYINEKYPDKNYNIKTDLIKQLKEIIEITMYSAKEKINKNNKEYQFEIFGYDFMLDENFNLFLIEVNTNPGLEESSPWIQIIVPRMLDDALRLTIDQLFNPGYDFSKMYKKEKKNNKLKIILKDFKDKIESDNKKLKTETDRIKKDIKKEENETNEMVTVTNNVEELIEKINKKEEIKTEVNKNDKNDKYISPFPIPGYKNDENLWEFVCDLTSKDPLDEFLDKEDICYTGIRYLFNKKKNNEK